MKPTDFLRGSPKARSLGCVLGIVGAIVELTLLTLGIAWESSPFLVSAMAFTLVLALIPYFVKRLDKPSKDEILPKRQPMLNLQDPSED
jgi:membrane protein implicated in regulation of membrane protease activity